MAKVRGRRGGGGAWVYWVLGIWLVYWVGGELNRAAMTGEQVDAQALGAAALVTTVVLAFGYLRRLSDGAGDARGDAANDLLSRAADAEAAGNWEDALSLYRNVAQQHAHPNRQYAQTCARELSAKMREVDQNQHPRRGKS